MSVKSLFSALLLAGLAATGRADGCPAMPPPGWEPAAAESTTSQAVPVPTTSSSSTSTSTSTASTTSTTFTTSTLAAVTTSVAAATTVAVVSTPAAVTTVAPVSTTVPAPVAMTPTTLITVVRSKAPTTSSTTTTPTPTPTPTPATSTPSTSSTKATAAAATADTQAAVSTSAAVSGESTFYGGNVAGGACSFSTYSLPSSLFGTAFSGAVWDNAAECGRCVKVTGPNGNAITAMIVDECPECAENHLDLFQNAFAELGEISAGIISTSYSFVPCGITSPLQLHSKSGTSAYWFSMQVVNANEGVTKLEVSTDGGSTWQSTTRTTYNFFENSSGFGADTVDVRVTSTSGSTVVVKNVSCSSDAQTTASANF